MITTKYRELRSQYDRMYSTLRIQGNAPSRGFDENEHIRKMNEIYKQMGAELDRIDDGYEEQQKELIRQVLNAYHQTRMAGTPVEDFILS